ncbi:aminoglycoside phosphotransferase [Peribacillus cavernae]|uniref:Aminoglycoside phosphotransferase n=2 Tax=Peribacillus cavernae TaxID=1674310 RepID=A0A433HHX2_9BACI|nr:phosphotransferase [Peribacillus cavernae]RUQ27772.1 aminoglycoside phosphotransferase [Peribacillus cavernae]
MKLTAFLKETGFTKTYEFCSLIPPFLYKNRLFSLIEYIKPHKEKFHFFNEGNREEGLGLLSQFHSASHEMAVELYGEVPTFNQIYKWEERLRLFESSIPIISIYVSDFILKELISWASWSLNGMRLFKRLFREEKNTIIHGDVAHHNFLRSFDGTLCLIDFDLIAVAPAAMDYLQYANRILPSVNYDHNALWNYKELSFYKTNPAFLYALAFPTDIFREWNRLIKENRMGNQSYLHEVWKLTVEDFNDRMVFYSNMAGMVENSSQ